MKTVIFTGTGSNAKQFALLRNHVLEFIILIAYAFIYGYYTILVTERIFL